MKKETYIYKFEDGQRVSMKIKVRRGKVACVDVYWDFKPTLQHLIVYEHWRDTVIKDLCTRLGFNIFAIEAPR